MIVKSKFNINVNKSEIERPDFEIKLKHYYFCKNLLKNGTIQV